MGHSLNNEELADLVFRQLEDCGAGGGRCLILRYIMKEMEREMGPWELAHHIMMSRFEKGAETFVGALRQESPPEAGRVDGLILAATWNRDCEELRADFGGD